MIEKRILVPDRVRRPPREGFSWIDRRFLHDFAARLSHDAIVLYFFLAAVKPLNFRRFAFGRRFARVPMATKVA